jgi:MFS family permease
LQPNLEDDVTETLENGKDAGTRKQASWRIFNTIFLVAMATVIVPPYFRLLGPGFWTLFGLNEAEWSVVSAVRALIFIIFVLAAGVIGDFWGRRRTLLLTLVPFIAASFFLVILRPGPVFMVVSGAASILGTMIRALTVTMVILAFEPRDRVIPVTIYSLTSGIVSALSPVLARAIGQSLSYQLFFLIPVVMGGFGFWQILKHVPESRAWGQFKRQNVVAISIWSFGICVVLFAAIEGRALGWTHPLVLTSFAIGALILIALMVLERLPLPEAWNFTLFYKGRMAVAIYAGIVINIALYAILLNIFNFLSRIQSYNDIIAGLALLPILVGAVGLTAFFARYTKNWTYGKALTASLLVLAVPAVGLSIMHLEISYWILVPFLMLVGFGFILGTAPRFLLLSTSVPVDLSATVQAIGAATGQIGMGVANSFMLTLIYRFGSDVFVEGMGEQGGVSTEQAMQVLMRLVEGDGNIFASLPADVQETIALSFEYIIKEAYVLGLSRAMLVLAALCLISAGVVYLAVRHPGIQKVDHEE